MKAEVATHEIFGVVEGETIQQGQVVGSDDKVNAVTGKGMLSGVRRCVKGDRVRISQTS